MATRHHNRLRQFYNEETKILHIPEEKSYIYKDGLGCLMFERMKSHGNNIAQIDADTGREDLYSSYLSRSIRTAIKMKTLGLQYGDFISIYSHNHLNNSVPAVAALFLGIRIASLDPNLSVADTIYLVNLVKPKFVFVSMALEETFEEVKIGTNFDLTIVVFGESDRNMKFEEFQQETSEEQSFKPTPVKSIEDDAFVIFSSGTTGLPKGIRLSHKYFIYHCSTMSVMKVVYGFATLYWISAVHSTISAALNGTTRVLCSKLNYKLIWEQAEMFKVTHILITPCNLIDCFEYSPKVTNVEAICIIGGSVTYDFLCKCRSSFPNTTIVNNYGLTELLFEFNPFIGTDKPGCVGDPLPERMFKVVDPETEEPLGFNQEGELRIKSEYCFSGYSNQNSEDCWDKDGYLKTGDIFYYDEDFCFFIVDRLKEMFKYRSWHIVPAKLEGILMSHPEVKYAAVVGVPHEVDDNHALAVVVPRDHALVNPEELRSFVDDRVDDWHKLRAGVKVIKEMPLTPTGKIRKRDLVKMYLNGSLDQ